MNVAASMKKQKQHLDLTIVIWEADVACERNEAISLKEQTISQRC